MNKKRFIKAVFLSAFVAAAYVPASMATTVHLYQRKDPDIEAYVEENLEQIIREQEKTLGITYPIDRPEMQYILPKEYRLGGTSGLYDIEKDTIYLPSGILTKPDRDLSDQIVAMVAIATLNTTDDVKIVLDHELAHFYCDKLREKALGKDYLLLLHSLFPDELIAYKLINEGIAEYFSKRINGDDEESYSFQDWPSDVYDLTYIELYQGGYALVKPIIDQHGEKGITFLLFNPPTPQELHTPLKYQERMLTSIAKLDQ